MKRRGFLGLFGKAAAAVVAAPVLAKIPEVSHLSGEELRDIRLKTYGTAESFDSEAEMYEGITGHSSFGLAQVKQEGTSVPFDYNFKSSGLLPDQVDEYGLIAEYRKKELMASIAQRKKEYLESESAFENIFK